VDTAEVGCAEIAIQETAPLIRPILRLWFSTPPRTLISMTGSQSHRRRAIQCFYRNGAFWGLGNGLVSSSLIIYLAGEFGAAGFAVSLILAMPRLVGVLRLGTPILIDLIGRRQVFCVRMFLAASIVLFLLPVVSAPGILPGPSWSLAVLVSMWTIYHLLEFLGLVALWSWIGDVVPDSIRGRFIGRRGALLNACQVVGMLVGGGSWWWRGHC
jgi:MFS family permease